MLHNVAFHQSLHWLLGIKYNITMYFEILTCHPSLYSMDHPVFIVCSFMEISIGLKGVKRLEWITFS